MTIIYKKIITMIIRLYFFIFMFSIFCSAQISKPYLGQPLPGTNPEIFAPGIISNPPVGAYSITISRNGDEIYFSRNDGTRNTTWFTKLVDTTWSVPAIASFAQEGYNTEAFFTPYSDTLLYISDRKDPSDSLTIKKRIWYVVRSETGWSYPRVFPIPSSARDRYSPSIAINGNIYFSEVGGISDWHIYKSELVSGVYQQPVKLGNEINGFTISAHCYIASDESFMIFDAMSATGGFLYFSKKNIDGSWNTAIKLDEQINSTNNQYLAYLSSDKKYLFFTKNQNDIYWCEWKNHNPVKVENNNFDKPTGIILNQNFPNPFNPSTKISYSITQSGLITLKIYDVLGTEIETLVNEEKPIGTYELNWGAVNLPSGVYFYRIHSSPSSSSGQVFIDTKKMILLR
jgi:hypothetical protein